MGLQGYVGDASDARKLRALESKRAADREALEKAKLEAEKSGSGKTALREFGQGESEAAEAAFKAGTVGLVTREQFLATKEKAEAAAREAAAEEKKRKRREGMMSSGSVSGGAQGGGGVSAAAAAAAAKRAAARGKLSFGDGEEEEDEEEDEEDDEEEEEDGDEEGDAAERRKEGAGATTTTTTTTTTTANNDNENNDNDKPLLAPPQQRRRLAKDPTVRTDFLPDADEEAREAALRAALLEEFEEQREKAKAAPLEVVFSYWDGAGHRRQTTVAAGSTIGAFLGKARALLAPQFRELRSASASDLLYVKEDCILPSEVTFHELISRRARGKSGPLFHFDVRDDVRLQSDATREKDESHAGKVVTRAWYGRNKHMFPASRWEVWDSGKGYGEYTVKGK